MLKHPSCVFLNTKSQYVKKMAVPKLVLLTIIIDWTFNALGKSWVRIENTMSETLLKNMIWVPPKYGHFSKNMSTLTRDVLKEGESITFKELRQKTDIMVIDKLKYFQLKHFVKTLPQPIKAGKNQNPFDKILSLKEAPKYSMSLIYKTLNRLMGPDYPPYLGKWEVELGTKWREKDKRKKKV